MKQPSKINLSDPKLKLIQDDSKILCYHCGSLEFTRAGKNQKGEQRYTMIEKGWTLEYLQEISKR